MPVLIFYAGVATLGRYEGASLGAPVSSLYAGLESRLRRPPGSCCSAPMACILLFRAAARLVAGQRRGLN